MAIYAGGVILGAVLCIVFWLLALIRVRSQIDGTLHRILIYFVIGSFVLVDVVVLLASAQNPGSAEIIRAIFGVAMGLQLIAAMAAFLFVRRVAAKGGR
jgi:hypothetical protein